MSTTEKGGVHFPVRTSSGPDFYQVSDKIAECVERVLVGRGLLEALGAELLLYELNDQFLHNQGEVLWTPEQEMERFWTRPDGRFIGLSAVSLRWRPPQRSSLYLTAKSIQMSVAVLDAQRLGWFTIEGQSEEFPKDIEIAERLDTLPDDEANPNAPFINTRTDREHSYFYPLINDRIVLGMSPDIVELSEIMQDQLIQDMELHQKYEGGIS